MVYIHRVAHDGVVKVGLYAKTVKAGTKCVRRTLTCILGDDHAADVKPHGGERIHKAHDLKVIGDAKVAANLVFFDVAGVYGNDDLRAILHFFKQANLCVRRKARQHAGSVKVVKKLSAELQIELSAEMADTLLDFFGLHSKIFSAVKPYFLHFFPPTLN